MKAEIRISKSSIYTFMTFTVLLLIIIIFLIIIGNRCGKVGDLFQPSPYQRSKHKSLNPEMDKFRFNNRTDCEEYIFKM